MTPSEDRPDQPPHGLVQGRDLVPTFRARPRRPRNFVVAGLAMSIGAAMGLEFVDIPLINAEPSFASEGVMSHDRLDPE